MFVFFFNDTATTEIYTLSLHDALPIYCGHPRIRGFSGRTEPVLSGHRLPRGPATGSAGGSEIVIRKKTAESTQTANQILQNLEKLSKNQHQTEEIKDKYEDIGTKNRGFVAQITSLKDDSFKIRTPDDEEFFITPDKSTTIIKKGKVTTGDSYTMADWFAIDDWLVLIGTQNGEVFSPRRIIVSSESLAPQKNFVIKGVIKNVTSSKVEIMPVNGNSVETFKIDKQTNLLDHHKKLLPAKTYN